MIQNSWAGYACLAILVAFYAVVVFSERLGIRRSKPVIMAGTMMWALIAFYEALNPGVGHGMAQGEVTRITSEIGALFFFVFVVMTYINVLQERRVFDALTEWLRRKNLGYGALFWATGLITFLLSPVTDNLTSAFLMATVAGAVGGSNRRFIVPAFINIVVAANAGGAWSPFGDITTLLVWTSGRVDTAEFALLFAPAFINWITPALLMFPFVPKGQAGGVPEPMRMKPGAWVVIIMGAATLATAVAFRHLLRLPPFLGVMMGLGYLMAAGYLIWLRDRRSKVAAPLRFDIFTRIQMVEFDTLLFFFGIIFAIGALKYIGFLAVVDAGLYGALGSTGANVLVGALSAIVDNVPVMYAVLQMDPAMGVDQWLLVTLTAGVGGSLLSIGSAAGVAVMGVRRDIYTFTAHLKWTPVILAGYLASVVAWWLLVKG